MKKNDLVISGGGTRGAYELGVWQALRELGIPIQSVYGTSWKPTWFLILMKKKKSIQDSILKLAE